MPELVNYTPYPNFRYYSRDKEDRDFGVVIVKATYELGPSGKLERAEEQAPMVFTDRCHGAVNMTSLWHPSDLVPNKPATDVILNAVARAPNGAPVKSWACGVKIVEGEDVRLEKALRVTGPRAWQPVWKRALMAMKSRTGAATGSYSSAGRCPIPSPSQRFPCTMNSPLAARSPRARTGKTGRCWTRTTAIRWGAAR